MDARTYLFWMQRRINSECKDVWTLNAKTYELWCYWLVALQSKMLSLDSILPSQTYIVTRDYIFQKKMMNFGCWWQRSKKEQFTERSYGKIGSRISGLLIHNKTMKYIKLELSLRLPVVTRLYLNSLSIGLERRNTKRGKNWNEEERWRVH